MLHQIQSEIKAPKGQFNKFGNYKYRSCEDIVEAVKPVLAKHGFHLILSDEVVNIGNRFYIRATADILDGEGHHYRATAYAREDENIKGMAVAQITGSASSYARKYALNGLFAIDDTKDADATNTHYKEINDVPEEGERQLLRQLVYSSDLTAEEKESAMGAIETCQSYEKYDKIRIKLEGRQIPYDQIPNPSATDAKKQVRKIVKQVA